MSIQLKYRDSDLVILSPGRPLANVGRSALLGVSWLDATAATA